MDNSLSLLGIATSLTLPWAFGITWMLFLMGRTCRWNCWIVADHGYLMGIFLTTLIMRASDFAEFLQNFQGIVAAISLLTLVGIALLCARPPMKAIQPTSIEARQWQRAFIVALVFFIVYRYTGLAREILLRPLYPWDAWMNWTPKAINWFHNRQLTEFISPSNWLEYSGDTLAYTTGATNAWKYPVTVPLIQLWGMLGAGSADQNYSNLPWLFAPLAFSLSLYGHLRLVGA